MSFKVTDIEHSDDVALEKVKVFIESNPTKLNEIHFHFKANGTLLHFSCLWNKPKVVSYLLSKNADVTKCFVSFYKDYYNGLTAQQIAEKDGHVDIVKLFEQSKREQAEREQVEREQAASEQAAREQAEGEQAEREQAAREAAKREQDAREQAEREQAAREAAEREKAAREKIYQFLNELEFDESVIQKIERYGVRSIKDFVHFGKDDWDKLDLLPFQKNKILISQPIVNILAEKSKYSTIKAKVLYNGKNTILNLTILNLSDLQEQIKNKLNIIGKFRIEYLDKDFGVFAELLDITELKDLVEFQISTEKENIDSKNQGSITVLRERGNRREPPSARITPGKRFLAIIQKVLSTPKSVIEGLEKHASENQLPLTIIQNFKDKIEDFSENNTPECSFALALCWLYTTESWVYPQVNTLLRDDSSTMVTLAPFMKALIESYKHFEGNEQNLYSGVVYRRTKLTTKGLEFYKPNLHFVWSAFTSTSIEFNPSGEFGSVLFEITIPEPFKKYALCLENISVFPTEREVLMLPNIAYRVVSIENNPDQYPNTTCVIKISIEYVCLVL